MPCHVDLFFFSISTGDKKETKRTRIDEPLGAAGKLKNSILNFLLHSRTQTRLFCWVRRMLKTIKFRTTIMFDVWLGGRKRSLHQYTLCHSVLCFFFFWGGGGFLVLFLMIKFEYFELFSFDARECVNLCSPCCFSQSIRSLL